MCMQLCVICIGMCTESMTLGDCSDVGSIENEKYWYKHTSLRNATIQCRTSRPLPVKINHLHSIADKLARARAKADPRTLNDVRRRSIRMSWSTISKAANRSIKLNNVISPRSAASRPSEIIFKILIASPGKPENRRPVTRIPGI